VDTAVDRLALVSEPARSAQMLTSVFTHANIWQLLGNLFFSIASRVPSRPDLDGRLPARLSSSSCWDQSRLAFSATSNIHDRPWRCGYMGMFLLRYPRTR
jgi:hypothetical protein